MFNMPHTEIQPQVIGSWVFLGFFCPSGFQGGVHPTPSVPSSQLPTQQEVPEGIRVIHREGDNK